MTHRQQTDSISELPVEPQLRNLAWWFWRCIQSDHSRKWTETQRWWYKVLCSQEASLSMSWSQTHLAVKFTMLFGNAIKSPSVAWNNRYGQFVFVGAVKRLRVFTNIETSRPFTIRKHLQFTNIYSAWKQPKIPKAFNIPSHLDRESSAISFITFEST